MSQKSSFDKTLNLVLGDKTHSSFNFLKTDSSKGVPGAVWESFQTSHDQANELSVIQPSQAPSETVFGSANAYTEFLFQPSKNRITQIILNFAVQSPGATLPISSDRMISHIEYYSGSTLIGSADSLSLWSFQAMTRSPAEKSAWSKPSNQSPNYYGMSPFTEDETKTFYLDITGPLSSLVTGFVREQIRIRLYYEPEANWSWFANSDGQLSPVTGQRLKSVRLISETTPLANDEFGIVQGVYHSGKFMHRFIEPRVVKHALSISNNGTYTISLSGLHGAHSAIFVACQAKSNIKQEFLDVFEKCWITDSNGTIVSGGVPFDSRDLNTISAGSFAGPFLNEGVDNTWVPFLFSKSCNSDISRGTVGGSLVLRSQGESLNFSTGNVNLVGSKDVNIFIIGAHFSAYRVVDGNLVSLR